MLDVKQILYASVSARTDGKPADVLSILERSRHNNALDGITGLLWTDGQRFLQVIEGEDAAVDACFGRIRRDDRHHAVVTIIERTIDDREFGYWAMAHKTRVDLADQHDARVRDLMAVASPDIAAPFLQLISTRQAA